MAMHPPSSPLSVVVDASFLVGLCAKEPDKHGAAEATLVACDARGCTVYAPHLAVMEVLYALCRKLVDGRMSGVDYEDALGNLQSLLTAIEFPRDGDASLIAAAERIRAGYGCSRSADSMYIALAEELAARGPVELLTFDAAQARQAAATAPSVTVTLLTSQN
jgi:predicted nucleic acid-binding protein